MSLVTSSKAWASRARRVIQGLATLTKTRCAKRHGVVSGHPMPQFANFLTLKTGGRNSYSGMCGRTPSQGRLCA